MNESSIKEAALTLCAYSSNEENNTWAEAIKHLKTPDFLEATKFDLLGLAKNMESTYNIFYDAAFRNKKQYCYFSLCILVRLHASRLHALKKRVTEGDNPAPKIQIIYTKAQSQYSALLTAFVMRLQDTTYTQKNIVNIAEDRVARFCKANVMVAIEQYIDENLPKCESSPHKELIPFALRIAISNGYKQASRYEKELLRIFVTWVVPTYFQGTTCAEQILKHFNTFKPSKKDGVDAPKPANEPTDAVVAPKPTPKPANKPTDAVVAPKPTASPASEPTDTDLGAPNEPLPSGQPTTDQHVIFEVIDVPVDSTASETYKAVTY